jgi:hypothetical protein
MKAFLMAKARANLTKFCAILDDLPINFSFRLDNVSEDFDGCWKKTVSDGTTAWQNGPRILFNSAFFPKRKQVFEAIEKEGWPVSKLYFLDTKFKKAPLVSKGKVIELYHEQEKSLQDIAKEYGCTKQWICLLMEKYGVKRRAAPEALREAVMKNKITLIKPKR